MLAIFLFIGGVCGVLWEILLVRCRMEETTIFSKKIITRNKAFFLDLKENPNGKFLKVTESNGEKRSFIFIPEEGLKEFGESIGEIISEHVV